MIKIDDNANISPICSIGQVSLMDFPGKISLMLWVGSCNLKCGFCHNPTLTEGSTQRLTYETVLEAVEKATGRDWVNGVVISGGEPTIFTGLYRLITEIKKLKLAVKIDSNGTRPTVIKDIKNILDVKDYIALDYKIVSSEYNKLTGDIVGDRVLLSIDELRQSTIPYELRTTIIESIHTPEIFRQMMGEIKKQDKWVLQSFSNKHPLLKKEFQIIPPTSKEYLEELHKIAKNKGYNIGIRE